MKELKFYNKDRGGKSRQCGSMMIKNQTDTSADLYFYGDIASETWQSDYYEEDMAPGDVKEFLDELTGTEKINIHINSGGGSVFGGIAIYNMLKRNDAYKTVYIDGLAASIASVIAMVGDEVIIPKNAAMMIHKPMTSYFWTSKNADELRKDAEALDSCQELIMNTYMTKAKATREEIEEKINDETWLTGEEAAELFDLTVEEENNAVAYAGSAMFFSYKNMPEQVEKKAIKEDQKNDGKLSKERIKEIFNEAITEFAQREKEKAEILQSLDQYGERK